VSAFLYVAAMTLLSTPGGLDAATSDEEIPSQVIQLLSTAAYQRDFGNMISLAQSEVRLRIGYCHSELGGEITPGNLITLLNQQAREAVIEVNKQSSAWMIETTGWPTEYPFRYFWFVRSNGKWLWTGVCDDSNRMLEFRKRPDTGYMPRLPRPGPRVFQDKNALRDRIQEPLQFHQPEALKVYVVRQEIVLGLCKGKSESKQLSVTGDKVPADEVIEFIKTGELRRPVAELSEWIRWLTERLNAFFGSKPQLSPRYEGTPGEPLFEWKNMGPFPHILFWAEKVKDKWEWSGVSYCKVPHQSLLFPDDPRYKQDKNK
jgi:hypothetical protein